MNFQAECGWFSSEERSESPIILWWTPFTGEQGNWRTCGEDTCFFTENRTHLSDPKTKVGPHHNCKIHFCWWNGCVLLQMVVFYGSSFAPLDVPLPRQPWQNWALLHEESPKNNLAFCYEPLISLFNYTATWSRNSSFPLTLLSLPKLSDITGIVMPRSAAKYWINVSICMQRSNIFCICGWEKPTPNRRSHFSCNLRSVLVRNAFRARFVC